MPYAKFIHDYLDGELNEAQKEALFGELAVNPGVRYEFDQQVRLHMIAQNDMATISPPMETTSAVFSALGFSIPSGDYLDRIAGSRKTGFLPKAAAFWRKHSSTLAAALIAASITALIFMLFESGQLQQSSESLAEKSNIPVVSSFENNSELAFNTASDELQQYETGTSDGGSTAGGDNGRSFDRSHNGVYGDNNNAVALNTGFANTDEDESNSTDNISATNRARHIANILHDNSQARRHLSSGQYSEDLGNFAAHDRNAVNTSTGHIGSILGPDGPFSDSPSLLQGLDYTDNTKWLIEIKRNSSLGFAPNIEPVADLNNSFSDLTLLGMYKLDRNHGLGLEIGREQFPQKFREIKNGGGGYTTQNPMIFWAGGAYRYTLDGLGQNIGLPSYLIIAPYGQIFAGYTSIGPLLRGQVGLQVRYYGFSVSVSLNNSYLRYRVGDDSYGSDKFGISYGLSYNF